MNTQVLSKLEPALYTFKTSFRGQVLTSEDADYNAARALWNGMIDKRPALIAKCADVADVVAAINFASTQGLSIAVRGGGHNVAGLAMAEGGLVIDLSQMNVVQVDPLKRIARVQGGATIGNLDRATQAHGLATPMGVVSATGIAGLTLGGGMGWLRRKYGLSCDNLVAAEVVTASGEIVRASEDENPELLWGLRGGGGNFGVVSSFEYRLHEVGPEVAFTFVFYPLGEIRRVLHGHEAFLRAEPGAVSTLAVTGRVPSADPFPRELHGTPFVGVLGMYAGGKERGMEAMRPLRRLAEPLIDLSGPMPYLEAQQLYDPDYPNGHRYYWKSSSLMELSNPVIDLIVKYSELAPSDEATIDLWYQGGAIARPGEEATAFGRRDIPYIINPEANWERPEGDAANIGWVRDFLQELKPHAEAGLYLNFPGFLEEGEALVKAAFGRNYARLVTLKTRYDPENLFKLNHNIKPKGDLS